MTLLNVFTSLSTMALDLGLLGNVLMWWIPQDLQNCSNNMQQIEVRYSKNTAKTTATATQYAKRDHMLQMWNARPLCERVCSGEELQTARAAR